MPGYKNLCIMTIFCLILAGCAPAPAPIPAATQTTLPPTVTPQPIPSATLLPSATSTTTPAPSATPDPSVGFVLSSPLQDIALAELKDIISNPFQPTTPGLDDGHHGTDFSYYAHGTHMKMEGLEIYSLLPGKVAGVIYNRKPYGNAIIIETPFTYIPATYLTLLNPPQAATPFPYNPRLTGCESLQNQSWVETPSSVYVLYGHMKDPPVLQIGDSVSSGELIGLVGNTGASGNPHLHLEIRLGTGGTKFASMSHYDGSATPQERIEYCNWRISGKFIMLDPMEVINSWLNLIPKTSQP
jgi:murein DD-endopeptidase MepM/ murein hydrolase activator NlpD